MAKTNRNSGKPWTRNDIAQLKRLITENTPTRVIGLEIGRTPGAIYTKVSDLGLSLKPTNQSPYNRRKKS
jgi:transposase